MDSGKIESIARLTNEFSKLPGVGKKTAARYAYYIINSKIDDVMNFVEALKEVKAKVRFCEVCGNYTDISPCHICSSRKHETICVEKEPKDVDVIEKSGVFKGTYHVLNGTINPIAGVGPDDIRIKELLSRINEGEVKEVIMATNADVEGEATAMYIAKILKPLDIKVSRIAQGVQVGSDLEYADEVTLARAITDRRFL